MSLPQSGAPFSVCRGAFSVRARGFPRFSEGGFRGFPRFFEICSFPMCFWVLRTPPRFSEVFRGVLRFSKVFRGFPRFSEPSFRGFPSPLRDPLRGLSETLSETFSGSSLARGCVLRAFSLCALRPLCAPSGESVHATGSGAFFCIFCGSVSLKVCDGASLKG